MPPEFSQVSLSDLRVGSVLTAPIYDPGQQRQKLLGEAVEIDQQVLSKLEARGVTTVSVSKRDLAAMSAGLPQGNRKKAPDVEYQASELQTEHSQELENEIKDVDLYVDLDQQLEDRWNSPPMETYEPEAVREKLIQREKHVEYVESLFEDLSTSDQGTTDELTDLCSSSIASVLEDKDLFLCLGLNPFDSEYPSRHSLHVSSVAIAIGVMLGLDDDSLHDLGTGCLIHDVGMLKLDRSLYRAKRRLTRHERSIVAEHPILTLEALACPGVKLSRISRIVAYQIHERCDGSGYPRGIESDEMHCLSKIAAVADAYVGLVSNRSHRRALMPYFAIEKILLSLPEGLFEPKVVRGLLHAVSLFPIGSYIETSNARLARVVRATGESYTRPVVEFWDAKHQQFEPDLVNLANDSSLAITRAIPTVKAA